MFPKLMLCLPLCLWASSAAAGESRPLFAVDHPLRRAPVVAAFSVEELPSAELLGTPSVRTLLGYTRRPLHLTDGETMAVFSYSNSAPANWLFLVRGSDLAWERFALPNNDIGSHAAALSTDGDIYLMPYATARAYRFDVATKAFEELGTELPEGEYTWDAIGGQNGAIYFGTYPNAYFGEYDPAKNRWTLWKQFVPNTKYVTNFSVDAAGIVHCKAWGPDEVWLAFDPDTRELTRSDGPPEVASAEGPPIGLPAGEEGYTATIQAEGRWLGVSHPSGRLWELTDEAPPVLLGKTGAGAQPVWWLKAVPGAIFGISYYGALFRLDLESGAIEQGQVDNLAAGGNAIMFLETITANCVLGANYSQQNLFRVDPENATIQSSPDVVARVTGEPMCAVGHNGIGWVGIYVSSILSRFDPAQPFAFQKNPREIIELGGAYEQTRPRAAVTDGEHVFISSDSSYNHLGGALAVVDPKTEYVDVYHHLIQDQNLPTLTYDSASGLLWGGTDRWGQMRSHPPTQESALFYAFDSDAREVVGAWAPWPEADLVNVLGAGGDGVLVVACGQELLIFDTVRRQELYRGAFPGGLPGKVRRGADGASYCLVAGVLYRWDLESNTLTALAKTDDGRYLTESRPGTWVIGNTTSLYRIQL